jgi:hypothetical protein
MRRTVGEYREPRHPAHKIAVGHKKEARRQFAMLAKQAGLREPEALADRLLMLMDGAWVAARMFDRANPARHVAGAAEAILQAHE